MTKKTKILIIEDEKQLRDDMVDMLTLEGYSVSEAENGRIGILKLRQEKPDLVLCDIAMPEFSGYRVLEYIRDSKAVEQTPFIFVTARVDRNFVRHGMEMGADDYITKPFSQAELLASIKSRLRRFRTLTEVSELKLEDAKKRLTRLVSHELRTPVTSISMIQEIISNKVDALSPDDLEELMNILKSGSQRMYHVVEQMVLMTRIDTGLLIPEHIQEVGSLVPIWELVEKAVDIARRFAYRHAHGQVVLKSVKQDLMIKCDRASLHHAFGEIIANALEYSPPGTHIEIQQRQQEGFAWITIVDNGPGLTTNRLRIALQPFEQVGREIQEQQGMGLGLPLAKKIIELHGGDILFRQVASGGTQVIIQIPLAQKDLRTDKMLLPKVEFDA